MPILPYVTVITQGVRTACRSCGEASLSPVRPGRALMPPHLLRLHQGRITKGRVQRGRVTAKENTLRGPRQRATERRPVGSSASNRRDVVSSDARGRVN